MGILRSLAFSEILAGTTCVLALIVSLNFYNWWRDCEGVQRLMLRPLLPSVMLAKLALALWAASNLVDMFATHDAPPLTTLPSRVVWLGVVIWQIFVILRMNTSR